MKCAKSILVFCLLIPAVISCKSLSSQSNFKADIREIDQSVRVIYREGNTVFLVTCPLENGEVNDHVGDEKVLGRESCNDKTAAKDAKGKPMVKTMPFDSEYEPKLKRAIGFQGVTNIAERDALKAKIAAQQNKLDKLVASGLNTNANSDLIEKQAAKVNQNLEALKAQLGNGDDAETKFELFSALISYLDVTSQAAFNIAQSEAGQLLAPFGAIAQCDLSNRFGMTFCSIPAGTFTMGASENDQKFERPQHQVTISKGFAIQETEVTQGQWVAVMRTNPSAFQEEKYCPGEFTTNPEGIKMCPNNPVDGVNFLEVHAFIAQLHEQPDGFTYRLPSEAEWEYAARGGTTEAYAGDVDAMAWHIDNSGGKSHRVGTKQANAWGLYDMHGNIMEWTADWYLDYSPEAVIDPKGPSSGTERVVRGGGWYNTREWHRSSQRAALKPEYRGKDLGFRVVRERS